MELNHSIKPQNYDEIVEKGISMGFTMASDYHIGSLLCTLVYSKPDAKILELGTGLGLSMSWMVEALNGSAHLTTLDNDQKLTEVARSFFGQNDQVSIICDDGERWIRENMDKRFDLIFADAWPGKYNLLDETLELLKPGGFYIIDDMLPQDNWPDGHHLLANELIDKLCRRQDLRLTSLEWSTGVIICVKL